MSPASTPPRVMLDGLDLASSSATTSRERELERLRAQLENSDLARQSSQTRRNITNSIGTDETVDLNLLHPLAEKPGTGDSTAVQDRGNHAGGTESGGTESPVAAKKRRVQWIGLADEAQGEKRRMSDVEALAAAALATETASTNHPGHVSVSVPSTPADEPYGFDWTGTSGASDGMRTPGVASDPVTPEVSRPGTPDEHLPIPSGERDGLPLPAGKRGRTFTREAAKLVAMHKAKNAFLGRKPGQSHADASASSSADTSPVRSKNVPGPSKSALKAREALYNDEHTISTPAPPVPGGSGVLSTLLKLYEQPQSNHSSQATLVAGSSRAPSPDHLETSPNVPTASPQRSQHRAPATLDTPPAFSEKRQRSNPQLSGFFKDAAVKWHDYRDDRPATAKSHAGVFGALGASSFALAGAATPTGSTVAPAPQRPGFRLSRYSMPEVPTQKSFSRTSSPAASGTVTPTSASPPMTPGGGIYQRRVGSSLNLSTLAKAPVSLAKGSERLAKENLDPKKYHRESKVLRANKTSASNSRPTTPQNEYELDEKTRANTFAAKGMSTALPPANAATALRKKKDKRRQEEIFITMHVAAILQRQDFILRLARALMMFGAPPHRIETQIQQTAKVLEIECQVIYIVNFMIVSFVDSSSHTSDIRMVKQGAGLDLHRLNEIAILHWEVMHDKIGVAEASEEISNLMTAKPHWNNLTLCFFGACCSACISIAAFNASFIDLLVSAGLGSILVAIQCFITAKSDILSSIFEIIVTTIISFVAAALASTEIFCYAAITSSSIVLILPGWPTCTAALELQSRSLVSGSVRLVYAVVYALFLGFGISLGAQLWTLFSGQEVFTSNDNTCSLSHDPNIWYRATIPQWFYFIAVPGFPLFLSLRNFAKLQRKETLIGVLIAGAGWNANHWSVYGFPGRSDISSAIGAFVVAFIGTLWGKYFQSTAFIVSVTGIMFQLPSGLGNGGLLAYATTNADTVAVFQSGWSVAQQLISTVIGMVVGIGAAIAILYPFGKRRGGLMSF